MRITKSQLRRIIKEEVDEGKLQDQVVELVRGLDTEEYEVFAFDNGVDTEDANQMMDFIAQLSNKDAKAIIKQLSESVVNEAKLMPQPSAFADTTQLESNLRMIVREALSAEVPDVRPRRKSSWQAHKERTMADRKAQFDASIEQIAAELIKNPGSVSDLLTTFKPAIDLDKYQQTFAGAGRIDAFLDKVEASLQARGVDRSTSIKFADSFLKFR